MTGLIVLAIPIACAALSFAGYRLARALKLASVRRVLADDFAFSFSAAKNGRFPSGRAVIDGRDAAVSIVKRGRRLLFCVSIKHDSLLPPSLVIEKRYWPTTGEEMPPGSSSLGAWHLGAINESLGREVFDKDLINGFWHLHDRTGAYSFSARGVDFTVPIWTAGPGRLAGLVRLALGLAVRLAEINQSRPLADLPLVRHARFIRDLRRIEPAGRSARRPAGVNISTFAALLRNFKKIPGGRLELQRFLQSGNFDVGLRAAEALGMDAERYAVMRMTDGDEAIRARAARFLCELGRPGSLDFLADFYRQRTDAVTKIDIIDAFRDFPNSLSRKFLIGAAASGEESVRLEAAAALARLGGREEMAALYKLMADRALPNPLRQAVQAAVDRIKARLGPQEAGQLSVAQDESGGLSMAEGDSAGGLSLSGEKNPPDTES